MNKACNFLKTFFSLAAIFFIFQPLYAQSDFINRQNYAEYVLENGMQVFVLEDFSSAPVRIEYTVRAGISAQSSTNTGFFKLYTQLFKYGAVESDDIQNLSYECNADSARYITTVSPSKITQTMQALSRHAFAPAFSDKNIQKELTELKTEVMQYAYTPQAFINASIDSRVFSEAPWKQDSGIYPSLFTKTTPSQARVILSNIARSWYTPQNSALFISGSIKKEAALTLAKSTFGAYGYVVNSSRPSPVNAGGAKRKFVLYDSQFSEDLTQIVVQYTSLDLNQSDLLATVFNQDFSSFKKNLLQENTLNIRGAEYINAASAHKNGSSRVIIQSLLEKNKKSPLEQTELFIKKVKEGANITPSEEFDFSKDFLHAQFNEITASSKVFMEHLAEYWALEQLAQNKDSIDSSMLAVRMCNRPLELKIQDHNIIKELYTNETPFVFVLVNSKTYNKYKAAFTKAGYSPINSKNGSWYMQKFEQNAHQNIEEENNFSDMANINSDQSLKRFISESRSQFASFNLKNGIPVCIKTNEATQNVVILLSINGGKLTDGSRPGFQNVMANAFASNIQTEINRFKAQGILESYPQVLSETLTDKSIITIECIQDDVNPCIKAISNALIYGEIAPADADSYVYSVQTQKRLNDASPVNQLTSRAIRYMYDSPVYRNIFDSENDILTRTNYLDILSSYPKFLDAKLYSIIIVGNTTKEIVEQTLEESFSILNNQNTPNLQEPVPLPDFPSKIRKINLKLLHLFYTDIAAEDAGPMPAVLVPTQNFSDPVQYWLKAPLQDQKQQLLFNAILLRFKEYAMEKLQGQALDIKLQLPNQYIKAAGYTMLNVEHTQAADTFWTETVKQYIQLLQNTEKGIIEAENIKSTWIMEVLGETQSNRGTAKLIANSNQDYLTDYETILASQREDFLQITQEFLLAEPLLRIYSADSKK